VKEAVAEPLAAAGRTSAPALLPVKTLATSCGLAEYGRNNITYVPGMGSFHRLVAVFTDLPADEDTWQEPKRLAACDRCRACREACPTAAIGDDRFLLHAELCLTFWNEKPGDVQFPSWINPAWHNCLVGCMRCQDVCPENRAVLGNIEPTTEFSEAETELLLAGTGFANLSAATRRKLEEHDLAAALESFPRNLNALLSSPTIA
jgi:epoxyqueuosine reductase